jgi:hypothetical protein
LVDRETSIFARRAAAVLSMGRTVLDDCSDLPEEGLRCDIAMEAIWFINAINAVFSFS